MAPNILVYLFINFFGSTIIVIMITIEMFLFSEKKTLHLSTMFNPLHSSTNQQLFKRTSAIKVTPMKITDDFHYELKASHAYHKINTFCGEQRWMVTKEGTGKSIKNALHVQPYDKMYLSGWTV